MKTGWLWNIGGPWWLELILSEHSNCLYLPGSGSSDAFFFLEDFLLAPCGLDGGHLVVFFTGLAFHGFHGKW